MNQPIPRSVGVWVVALAAWTVLPGASALGQTRPGTNPGGYYIGNAGGVNRGGATGVYIGGYPSGYQRTNGSGYYIGGNVPPGPSQGDLTSPPESFVPPYSGPSPEGPGNHLGGRRIPNTAAVFHIRVPANAEIRVDGQKTRQTGTNREFFTPPLAPWQAYTYHFWVHWMDKGKPVDQFRQIKFYAGDRINLDFRQP